VFPRLSVVDRHVIARESNVLRVDFSRPHAFLAPRRGTSKALMPPNGPIKQRAETLVVSEREALCGKRTAFVKADGAFGPTATRGRSR
jgi:hypothetical protein